MLRFLSIGHLAVIDRLELEFAPGLNVLTGETGAGKSILVGAVGLLVGGRASADLVRTGEEQASVQAVFERPDGTDMIVRREVSTQGRSRAFIDGVLVTTTALREQAGGLVDLHGQHEHQRLLDPSTHLDLLDAFAGLGDRRTAVATAFDAWQSVRDERRRLDVAEQQKASRTDFLGFQLAEIDRTAPVAGEDDELTAARQILANADRVRRLCDEAYAALYDGDAAALASLGTVWRRVADLAALDPKFAPHVDARDAIKSQLEDLTYLLRSYAAGIDTSPGRLQDIEDRLALLDRLKKKHGPTLADVIARRDQLRQDLDELEHSTARLADLEETERRTRSAFTSGAEELSRARRSEASRFSAALERALGELAMASTTCDVRFTDPGDEGHWSAAGFESAELYLSPNPGEDLRTLVRIASGGELSRIMLAIRTLVATDAPGKTLIFDEVDAGIGGAVADVVGARLHRLGERFQVLCITHLPQIAAYGRTHFQIDKHVRDGRTQTSVSRVDGEAREREIASMIGGAAISPALQASARDMLGARHSAARTARAKGKEKPKGESEGTR